jgi:thioredoxin reductase (NADPH)
LIWKPPEKAAFLLHMSSQNKNILLVGAGPIGIEVAAALKLSSIEYTHIEAGSLASSIAWWSPGTQIFSSPDRIAIADMPFAIFPNIKASREEYLNYLRSVVLKYSLDVQYYTRLISCSKTASGFSVELAESDHGVGGESEYRQPFIVKSKRQQAFSKIILAIGDMHLPKEIGIAGEEQSNVSHFFADPHLYFGTKVCIVGAKNSAAEAVVRLGRMGVNVIWCSRSLDFEACKIKPWLLPDLKGLIKEGRVIHYNNVEPISINGREMTLKSSQTEAESKITADKFLLLTGYRQDSFLYQELGIELIGEAKRPKFNSETMETNVAGVFVAGTGTAGTQIGGARVFIENCHSHSIKIARALGSKHPLFSYGEDRDLELREM